MSTQQIGGESSPRSVIKRLQAAQNQQDLETFLACIDPDYQSEQPVHPNRAFRGREQVRKNWSTIFSGVPDFRSEILRTLTDGNMEWTEWHWSGTHANGNPFEMRGVTIFGVRDNRIVWGDCTWNPWSKPRPALTHRCRPGCTALEAKYKFEELPFGKDFSDANNAR